MVLTYNEVNVVEKGLVKIYCGEGQGKSTSSPGKGIGMRQRRQRSIYDTILKGTAYGDSGLSEAA